MAQVRACLGFRRVGPEQECQMLTRLRGVPVEEEVGQERGDASRFERRQGGLTLEKVQLTEKPDVERRCNHDGSSVASLVRRHNSPFVGDWQRPNCGYAP